VTTRNDQHGVKHRGAEVRRTVGAGFLTQARGRALAYMYRHGGGPCYGREIERGAGLGKGCISRVFDEFVALGWMTEQGVEALPAFVARFGDLLGDLSTLPLPACAPEDASAHELGQMIRRACHRSKLTVTEAARRVNKAQSWLSYLMAGTVSRPDPAEVERLASVLSMPAVEVTHAVRLAESLCRGRT